MRVPRKCISLPRATGSRRLIRPVENQVLVVQIVKSFIGVETWEVVAM